MMNVTNTTNVAIDRKTGNIGRTDGAMASACNFLRTHALLIQSFKFQTEKATGFKDIRLKIF